MKRTTEFEFSAVMRQDFYGFVERSFYELNPAGLFVPNWHIEVIAQALEDCRRGKIKRLIINVPPRSLKSHCASVAFSAWMLGQNPAAQIICASYGQDLANKLASDTRTLMMTNFFQKVFPTRLTSQRPSLQELITTKQGFRMATSVGGVLTGRGADFIIIDDPLKPDQALSTTERQNVNDWYDHTLLSRLNDKKNGCIILIMQRLHEDDLVGHVLEQEDWIVLRFPAIAEQDESFTIEPSYGKRTFHRREGEALHPEREDLLTLDRLHRVLGDYNFAGQYQQAPAPLEGGLVKAGWFKTYTEQSKPAKFDLIFQSWDTANKPGELADFSVCTTWGMKKQDLYLLHVFRKRMDYPALKNAVIEQSRVWSAKTILVEDKASGTQLIQELIYGKVHGVTRFEPEGDKIMRMHACSSTIENGFVYLPSEAEWLGTFIHEIKTFPNGKHDDQVDSVSQALSWVRARYMGPHMGLFWYYKERYDEAVARGDVEPDPGAEVFS